MFTHLRSAFSTAALLLSPAIAPAQVYVPPVPGSAQAANSQIYHNYNGVPYYQGLYYPPPQGDYSSSAVAVQGFLPPSLPPVPGSAQAATSQAYHYFNGMAYFQGFYYPGPQGDYPSPTTLVSATTVAAVAVPLPTGTATLDVKLPAQADLYIQGQKTRQSGSERHFVTPPLAEGQSFTYLIKAVWSEDGRDHEINRTVIVAAGNHVRLSIFEDSTEAGTKEDGDSRSPRE